MDVRIRTSEWESDGELKRELSKYVTKGLQRNEIYVTCFEIFHNKAGA